MVAIATMTLPHIQIDIPFPLYNGIPSSKKFDEKLRPVECLMENLSYFFTIMVAMVTMTLPYSKN